MCRFAFGPMLTIARSITATRASPSAVILTASLMTAAPLAVPPDADAAPYSVWACATGSGIQLGKGDWVRNVSASFADVYDTCATPATRTGALAATARATSAWNAGGGGWVVGAAPGTRITSLDVWWSWQVSTSRSSGAIRVGALGTIFNEPNAGLDPFDNNGLCCSDSAFVSRTAGSFGTPTDNDPSVAFADGNHQSFRNLQGPDGPGTPAVGLLAACVNYCSTQDEVARYRAYRVKTVVDDAAAPTGTSTGLQDGLRVGSGTPIEATATDVGGGVREVTLRVDGSVVQRVSADAGCADVDPSNADPLEYNLMKPCPTALAAPLTLSAGQMPDNRTHTVTAVATDAAGQDTVLGSARAALAAPAGFYDPSNGFYNPDLNIAGGRAANGSIADPGARLVLRFARGRRTAPRQTVRYSQRPRIRGRVLTIDNKPIVGARVWRAARVRGGQWHIFGKALITSRTGRVSAGLPAARPNRTLRLVYFPYTDTNENAGSKNRVLRVQATTTIQSDQGGYRNGDTLKFTGQINRNRLIANKIVYLQAIVRGQWRTFKTTRADAQGRWRMTHRFEATHRPTLYTFRAVVPAQAGYAWATGYSRRVRVLVTP